MRILVAVQVKSAKLGLLVFHYRQIVVLNSSEYICTREKRRSNHPSMIVAKILFCIRGIGSRFWEFGWLQKGVGLEPEMGGNRPNATEPNA